MSMDIRKIKKLIELLEESGIAEIEIKEGEESVRISRQPVSTHSPLLFAEPTTMAQARPASHAESAPAEPVTPRKALKAPMVGTFYRAASPGAKALVDVGHSVNIGDPICIIEAMKMFNQIEADQAGVIAEVLAEDGQPIEYDQALFVLK
jgi:acetyl-CoA carboxylase biotin carboxyl carrier protein